MTNDKKKELILDGFSIHCPREDWAKSLMKSFHKLGIVWADKTPTIEYIGWDAYRHNTLYDLSFERGKTILRRGDKSESLVDWSGFIREIVKAETLIEHFNKIGI